MDRPYVFITRKLPDDIIAPIKDIAEVAMWPHDDIPVRRDVLINEAKKADALLTMVSDVIDQEVLKAGKSLKVVANMGVGFDNIDVAAATKYGIAVCNTPDVLTDTTADLTFALLLATARRVVEAAQFIKEGKWKRAKNIKASFCEAFKDLQVFALIKSGPDETRTRDPLRDRQVF